MLTCQYRMNRLIADWCSGELYGGRLTSPPPVACRTLSSIAPNALPADFPVLLFIDTAGCDGCEEEGGGGASRSNAGEAAVAMSHVLRLVDAGVRSEDVALISPYSAQARRQLGWWHPSFENFFHAFSHDCAFQVALLRALRSAHPLLSQLEISTVDGFQGREKEAVVLSCVRSSGGGGGGVGFLADERRFNVAVTRARRHLALIGDSDTLSSDPFLRRLCEWMERHGELRSAAELQ